MSIKPLDNKEGFIFNVNEGSFNKSIESLVNFIEDSKDNVLQDDYYGFFPREIFNGHGDSFDGLTYEERSQRKYEKHRQLFYLMSSREDLMKHIPKELRNRIIQNKKWLDENYNFNNMLDIIRYECLEAMEKGYPFKLEENTEGIIKLIVEDIISKNQQYVKENYSDKGIDVNSIDFD